MISQSVEHVQITSANNNNIRHKNKTDECQQPISKYKVKLHGKTNSKLLVIVVYQLCCKTHNSQTQIYI